MRDGLIRIYIPIWYYLNLLVVLNGFVMIYISISFLNIQNIFAERNKLITFNIVLLLNYSKMQMEYIELYDLHSNMVLLKWRNTI